MVIVGSKGQDQNNGTEMTALQKHVSFFDRDKDGVIYPTETFQGFRAIGCSIALSTVSAPIIHAFLSPKHLFPKSYEEIFQKHAHTHPDALTSDELKEMLEANQQPNDLPGSFANRTDWEILFSIAKDKDGLLQKDTVRSVYDGSLFYKLEAEKMSLK